MVAGSSLSYFKGQIDDVRIYARALNALEVQDLYHGGWQVAVPAQTGSSVLATSWSAAAPDGLEGYYRLDLRARDQEGNVSPANPDAWRGDVDTLGPRVSLTQDTVDSLTNRYALAAQDFNLTETGLQSPCGAGVVSGRRYFDSSWYLLTGADDRLYELDSECDLSVYATQNEVGAYATAGLAHSVAVSDTQAYVAAGAAGLQVVDVSDPGQPALMASLAISGTARDVVLDNYPLSGLLSVSAAQPAAAPAQPAPMANQAPAAKPAPGTVVITTPTPAVKTPTPAATTGSARDAGGKPLPAPAAVPHPEQAMLARIAPSKDAGLPGQTPTPTMTAEGPSSVAAPATPAARTSIFSRAAQALDRLTQPVQHAAATAGRWVQALFQGESQAAADSSSSSEPELVTTPSVTTPRPVPAAQSETGAAESTANADGRSHSTFQTPTMRSIASTSVMAPEANGSTTYLISAAPDGTPGDRTVSYYYQTQAVSGDGRWVAFLSYARNLTTDPISSMYEIYLYDTQLRHMQRVSTAYGGGLADNDSEYPSVSATGRYVVFSSWASNLVTPTLTTTDEQVFMLDQGPNFDQHTLEWVSVTGPGQSVDDGCNTTNQAVSADGRYVAYTCSYYSAGWHYDVYLRDRVAMTTTLVSHTPWGTAGNDDSEWAVISADGSTVAFQSYASNLLGADTNGDHVCDTGCDTNGNQDVFAYDTATGQITIASPGLNGEMADDYSYNPSISADGRYVAFESEATNLVAGFDPYDSDQIYRYDRYAGRMSLASVTATGEPANSYSWNTSISGDGRTVAFMSQATNLIPGLNYKHVNMHDMVTGQNEPAAISDAGIIGDGLMYSAISGALSQDGSAVVFSSTSGNLGDPNWGHQVYLRKRLAPEPVAPVLDLTLDGISAPSTTRPDMPFQVAMTVTNQGPATAGPFLLRLYAASEAPATCDAKAASLAQADVPALAAGATAVVQVSTQLAATGSYTLYGMADAACELVETNESNNTAGPAAITVSGAAYRPDVAVTGISVSPTSPLANGTYTVSVTVANVGNDNVLVPFDVAIYRTNRPAACDASSALTVVRTDALGAGALRVVNLVVPMAQPTGQVPLYAQADSTCEILDAARANNIMGPYTITVQAAAALPDFIISDMIVEPSAPYTNNPVTVTAIVHNLGPGGASQINVGFFDSIVPSGPGDVYDTWYSVNVYETLAAGASMPVDVVVPGDPADPNGNLSLGQHAFYGVANMGSYIGESDTGNNISAPVTVTVMEGHPDLVVASLALEPAAPSYGQPFTLVATIRNQGASSYWIGDTGFQLCAADCPIGAPCRWTGTGRFAAPSDAPALLPGQSTTFRFERAGLPGGSQPFYALVDCDSPGIVDESDETNNGLGPVMYTISGAPPTATPTLNPISQGQVSRVSVGPGFVQANAAAYRPDISSGGDYVTFYSAASNLATDADAGYADVFRRNRPGWVTQLLSGASAGGDAQESALSSDGLSIAWAGMSTSTKRFVYLTTSGGSENLSPTTWSTVHNQNPAVSANAGVVAFASDDASLVAGESSNSENYDIYVSYLSGTSRVRERISMRPSGAPTAGDSYAPAVSATDGRYVAFHSAAHDLVSGDDNGYLDVFVFDRDTDTTERISESANGEPANGDSTDAAISGDGRYVAFASTASNLVASDTNGVADIFVYDRQTQQMQTRVGQLERQPARRPLLRAGHLGRRPLRGLRVGCRQPRGRRRQQPPRHLPLRPHHGCDQTPLSGCERVRGQRRLGQPGHLAGRRPRGV